MRRTLPEPSTDGLPRVFESFELLAPANERRGAGSFEFGRERRRGPGLHDRNLPTQNDSVDSQD